MADTSYIVTTGTGATFSQSGSANPIPLLFFTNTAANTTWTLWRMWMMNTSLSGTYSLARIAFYKISSGFTASGGTALTPSPMDGVSVASGYTAATGSTSYTVPAYPTTRVLRQFLWDTALPVAASVGAQAEMQTLVSLSFVWDVGPREGADNVLKLLNGNTALLESLGGSGAAQAGTCAVNMELTTV